MSKSSKNIGWVTRSDGERDERFTMPQVLNADGSRDRRFNLFQAPSFGSSERLSHGRSQYYDTTNAPHGPGKYILLSFVT